MLESDIIRTFFEKWGYDIHSKEFEENLAKPLMATMQKRCGNPIHPKPDESLAFSILKPKTAALAFDRVYRAPVMLEPVPEEIGFYGATTNEIGWWGASLLFLCASQVGIKTGWDLFDKGKKSEGSSQTEKETLRFILSEFPKVFNQTPTVFYHAKQSFETDFPKGKNQILTKVISDVAMVDEENLEWEQVIEFRKDKEAKAKYIRFMRWLDKELLTSDSKQIEDLVAVKLDDYQWTLKKHGLKTVIGTISSLLDPKFLGSASAATLTTAFAAGGLWTTLTSLSLIIGKTAVTFGTKYIEGVDERRNSNYEIAYINEVKNKFT